MMTQSIQEKGIDVKLSNLGDRGGGRDYKIIIILIIIIMIMIIRGST